MCLCRQVDALRAKHAAELAETVREHNKRYSDMLAQRLNDEDALQAKLEAEKKVGSDAGGAACCITGRAPQRHRPPCCRR